jgi:hypothetical protein
MMAKFASDVGRPCVENATRFDAVRKVMQLAARDWTTAIGRAMPMPRAALRVQLSALSSQLSAPAAADD